MKSLLWMLTKKWAGGAESEALKLIYLRLCALGKKTLFSTVRKVYHRLLIFVFWWGR
jgi:hypothetical protein